MLMITLDSLMSVNTHRKHQSHVYAPELTEKKFNGENETFILFRLVHRFPLHPKIPESPENGQTL